MAIQTSDVAGEQVMEKVWGFYEQGGRFKIPIPYACDLHLGDDGFSVAVRPESLERTPKYFDGLNVPYVEVKKAETKKHRHMIPVKDGDPLAYELNIQFDKGHLWNRTTLHFGLTTAQHGAFREHILNRPALTGRVFLSPEP